MDYEKSSKRLEEILEKMESPDTKLEDLMENYKEAIKIYNSLEKYLTEYKQEIQKVADTGLVDFEEEEIDEE